MANFKSMLLAATIVAGTVASPAFAETAPVIQIPLSAPVQSDGALRGAGASSINNIIPRVANCIGPDNLRGNSSSATSFNVIGTVSYTGVSTDLNLDCSTEASNLQPNIAMRYVSTGSGFGRRMWRDFRNDFEGATPAANAQAGVFNPFVAGRAASAPGVTPVVIGVSASGAWSNVQFGFTDTPVSAGDIATYNTRAAPSAGAAISFPLYLLPVAIAYNSRYGTNALGQDMTFNAKGRGITNPNATPAPAPYAAIKLSKAAYCGIFNGTITNWNDPALKSLNSNTPLFDPTNDTAARWTANGAPIRLVGRMDTSGTTDIFTRHLAAVCNSANAPGIAASGTVGKPTYNPGVPAFTATNKFQRAAETLPYDPTTGVDFRSIRADVNLRADLGVGSAPALTVVAGSTNTISGDYWNGTAIVNIGSGSVAFPSTAGTSSAPTGNVGSGLFIVANGSSAVAAAVNLAPDYEMAVPGSTTGEKVKINGKVTYISSDFVKPSKDDTAGMTAATLQVGTGTLFANPTAAGAKLAIGTIAPPQSGPTGTFDAITTDTRQIATATAGVTVNATRDNPVAWAGVLYPVGGTVTLANPTLGYPLTGTTQILLYTCYNGANREAMVNHVGYVLGKYRTNGNGKAIATGIFNSTVPANPGIVVQSNIGVVPASWATAITNTFLSKSTDAGALNLYIQDRTLPTYQEAKAAVLYGDPGVPVTPTKPAGTIKTPAKTNIRIATNPNPSCITSAAGVTPVTYKPGA